MSYQNILNMASTAGLPTLLCLMEGRCHSLSFEREQSGDRELGKWVCSFSGEETFIMARKPGMTPCVHKSVAAQPRALAEAHA